MNRPLAPWLVVAALLLGATALPAATGAEPRFAQDRFAIGFWVDPPAAEQTAARFAEIARANFTFIIGNFGATTPEAVRRQLELCEAQGLKAIVSPAGLPPEQMPSGPACWGYALADEPGAGAFPELGRQVDALRRARPGKLAYINLFPNYASASALGAASYAGYVERFVREVRPDVLSMDHYPIFVPGRDGRDSYCANLEVLREQAVAAGIPFWNFFNAMPFGPHSDPTEAQLRWQISAAVAHGAKGVMYFCYWTPAGAEFPRGGAILRRDGSRTRHYEEARRLNAALQHLGPTLMRLTSRGVRRIRPGEDASASLAGTPLRALSPGDYLVGLFRHADGRQAVYLQNYEFAYSAWPTVEFAAPAGGVAEVSPVDGRETPLRDDSPDMPGLQLALDAGEGRLFLTPAEKR